jgi:hypothetical protein
MYSRLVFSSFRIPHASMEASAGPRPLPESTTGSWEKLRARDAEQDLQRRGSYIEAELPDLLL